MENRATIRNSSVTGNKVAACSVAGFTLIEMMIVLTIMGIALLLCIPMINSSREEYMLQQETNRLSAVLRMAASDAVIHSNEWGMRVTPESYGFVRFDNDTQQWDPVSDPVFKDYMLPKFLSLSIQSTDSMKLALDSSGADGLEPDLLLLSTGQTSMFMLRLALNSDEKQAMLLSGDGHSPIRVSRDKNDSTP